MTKLSTALLAAAAILAPTSAFADVSLSEMIQDDASVTTEITMTDTDSAIAHPGPHRGHNGPGLGRGPVYRPHYTPVPRPVYRVHYYRPLPPPPPRTDVVYVNSPSTVVASDAEPFIGSKFGMGIRGVGLVPSTTYFYDGSELRSKIAGGFGFYMKIRPIRWLSIETTNDYLFGYYDDDVNCTNYLKVPLTIGARVHVFDYGSLDVYGAAAFAANFTTLENQWGEMDYDNTFIQLGGQFGAGISLIAGGFEIGLDARYTIEEAPERAYFTNHDDVDSTKPIHGFLFSLNVGFAI